MLTKEEIQSYWDNRANFDSSAQSTTQDIYLREIELRVLSDRIKKLNPSFVADIGCGDGLTTIRLAEQFKRINFIGLDYSESMLKNAKKNLNNHNLTNLEFRCHDILNSLGCCYDLIYTTRCLINLPGINLQQEALRNIHASLASNGIYLMIENFEDGQANFNRLRSELGLPEIKIRNHNLFFDRTRLQVDIDKLFQIVDEVNISSTYYMATRLIYSMICKDNNVEPDYFDSHHRYASKLPFVGEFGPVRLLVLMKK